LLVDIVHCLIMDRAHQYFTRYQRFYIARPKMADAQSFFIN